jgi:hypothetical protein
MAGKTTAMSEAKLMHAVAQRADGIREKMLNARIHPRAVRDSEALP